MANIQNPYGGGAVLFNTTPFVQYTLQEQAKRRATDESLNKYYNDLQTNITPAGMRGQDIEGLVSKKNELQKFYIENKSDIKKGGKSYVDFMRMVNDAQSYVNKSKTEYERDKQIASKALDPEWRQRLSDDDLQLLARRQQPIYSKEFYKEDGITPYDVSDFTFIQPKLSIKDINDINSFAIGKMTPSKMYDESKVRIDKKAGIQIRPYIETFNPEQLSSVGEKYQYAYDTDKKFKAHVQELKSNPSELQDLNEVFKDITGREISNDRDLAAAFGMSLNLGTQTGEDRMTWTDPEKQERLARLSHQLRLSEEAVRQGNRIKLLQARKAMIGATEEEKTSLVDNYIDRLKKDGTRQNVIINGVQQKGTLLKLSDASKKMLGKQKDDQGNPIDFDAVIVLDNGDVRYGQFGEKSSTGNREIKFGGTVSGIDFKTQLAKNLFGTSKAYKDLGESEDFEDGDEEVESGDFEDYDEVSVLIPSKTNTKTYSLGGKKYSSSQVEAAAKASGMSVKEYIKKAGLK